MFTQILRIDNSKLICNGQIWAQVIRTNDYTLITDKPVVCVEIQYKFSSCYIFMEMY